MFSCFILCISVLCFAMILFTSLQHRPPAGHSVSLSAQNVGANELWRLAFCKPTIESPMSKTITFSHLTEPHITDSLSPLPFQKTAHFLPLSTQQSERDREILEFMSDSHENISPQKWLPSKRHLSSFVKGEPLCSAVQGTLTLKAASWLSIDESISKGQQV